MVPADVRTSHGKSQSNPREPSLLVVQHLLGASGTARIVTPHPLHPVLSLPVRLGPETETEGVLLPTQVQGSLELERDCLPWPGVIGRMP